ncbi:MAG: NAD-dependent malic enzyme [Planctomycetota bacterium]|nr:MAG: NAD-dependent malic enzyme [Planctomycetota bacterium]
MPHTLPTADQPNWLERYNAALIHTVRVRVPDRPGSLAAVLEAIASARTPLGDIRIVGADSRCKVRDIEVFCVDRDHLARTLDAIGSVDGVLVERTTDEVLEIHRGGTIRTVATVSLDTVMDLRMVYTPGVASVCQAVRENPEAALAYTAKGNKIAIVTNGTAVLGLGDIGALAGLPVMEGKAAILAHYVGVSAEPILIDSSDPAEVIGIVRAIASGYGAVQLEDISAPACFEIESALNEALGVPVFHDDQHGTATVCIAGLINALRLTGREPGDIDALVLGAGAAGLAIARFLVGFGVRDVVVCDSRGALSPARDDLNRWKAEVARLTNRAGVAGPLEEAVRGRNLLVGVSKPNTVTQDMVRSMAPGPIVFALANPVSEISAEDALAAGAAVAVDGRGMNNALAYPGIFRGALDARASDITHEMKLAAARALADAASAGDLLPSMTDKTVHRRVADAVADAWRSRSF